jgi:hypothetical protein
MSAAEVVIGLAYLLGLTLLVCSGIYALRATLVKPKRDCKSPNQMQQLQQSLDVVEQRLERVELLLKEQKEKSHVVA